MRLRTRFPLFYEVFSVSIPSLASFGVRLFVDCFELKVIISGRMCANGRDSMWNRVSSMEGFSTHFPQERSEVNPLSLLAL